MEQTINVTPQTTIIHMSIVLSILLIGVIIAIIAEIKDKKRRKREWINHL